MKVKPALTLAPFVFTFVPLKAGKLPHGPTISENGIKRKKPAFLTVVSPVCALLISGDGI